MDWSSLWCMELVDVHILQVSNIEVETVIAILPAVVVGGHSLGLVRGCDVLMFQLSVSISNQVG